MNNSQLLCVVMTFVVFATIAIIGHNLGLIKLWTVVS